jgi:hypothetical protein
MPDDLPDLPAEMVDSIGNAIEAPADAPIASNPPTQEAPAPEGTEQVETATEAPDSFTGLDPNTLPEDLQPYYKSMQADYTRKLQEAAPWRGLGNELGVDSPDSIKEAVELYTFLQDEKNVRALSEQLNQAFGTGQPAAPQPAATEPGYEDGSFEDLENPQLSELRSRVDQLTSAIQQRDVAAQEEAVRWQLMGEMNRQEAVIKEQHPDWGDDEWNALWSLSVAFDGNLMEASNHLDAAANSRVTRLLNSKAAVAQTPGLTVPAPNRVGEAVTERDYSDLEMRDLTKEAVEYVRGVVNQSE